MPGFALGGVGLGPSGFFGNPESFGPAIVAFP
jgi:hypothetical protein